MATHSSILAWRIPWTVWSVGVTKNRARRSDFHFTLLRALHSAPAFYHLIFTTATRREGFLFLF